MAGSLVLGGLAAGIPSGEKIIGPATINGTNIIGQITDLTLQAGDNTVAIPNGSVAVAIVFTYVSEPEQIKLRTNLNSGDAGLPMLMTGFMAFAWPDEATELILHAESGGPTIELSFI